MAMGLIAWHNGRLWAVGYNPDLGRVGYAPTLSFVAIGVVFFVIGVIPWPGGGTQR